MHEAFNGYLERLHPQFEKLMLTRPVTPCTIPKGAPSQVIYLLSEGDEHLYVGRANKLVQRMRNHCGPSSAWNQASFATKLARLASGIIVVPYSKTAGMKALAKHPGFDEAFKRSKARIREMDLRYVFEDDPIRQALLEIYVSIVLKTPYNDFNNH